MGYERTNHISFCQRIEKPAFTTRAIFWPLRRASRYPALSVPPIHYRLCANESVRIPMMPDGDSDAKPDSSRWPWAGRLFDRNGLSGQATVVSAALTEQRFLMLSPLCSMRYAFQRSARVRKIILSVSLASRDRTVLLESSIRASIAGKAWARAGIETPSIYSITSRRLKRSQTRSEI